MHGKLLCYSWKLKTIVFGLRALLSFTYSHFVIIGVQEDSRKTFIN